MGEVIDLYGKEEKGLTVIEALEHAMAIAKEEGRVDSIYIALNRNPAKGGKFYDTSYVMAGMTLPEAVGWLALHQQGLMEDE